MTGWSIRTRLTVWYLAVIVPATIALAIGSWWLARRSLNDEVDRTLTARLDGTREFLESMAREGLHGGEMKEEFGEYVELSRGAVLLEVTDAAGTVLSRPTFPGWAALADEASLAAIPSTAPVDRVESGEPFRVARAAFHAGAAEYRAVVATSTRPSHDALRRFAWLLGGLAPAVLLIAGFGGYWIAGRALAPVDRMTRTVQETTLRSLERRLEVPAADDELRRLAVTFNEMLARMQVGVADLTRLTAEASHELRTPVSLVRTTAEIALSRPRPADEYRQALKDVLAHAEHMSALVGDLLLLARADAGVEAGESGPVDLSEVARDVGEEFHLAAARRSLGFVVSADAAIDVRGDAGSFRRLLVILLENAVAYTPPGGNIDVRVTRSDAAGTRTAVVEVIDTGIGIEPGERARVFDRFYRGAAARAQTADGSGLGLSIARTIVERARGTIEIDAGPGARGCHVRVRLPADGEGREVEHASGRTHRVDFDRVGAGVGGPDAPGH